MIHTHTHTRTPTNHISIIFHIHTHTTHTSAYSPTRPTLEKCEKNKTLRKRWIRRRASHGTSLESPHTHMRAHTQQQHDRPKHALRASETGRWAVRANERENKRKQGSRLWAKRSWRCVGMVTRAEAKKHAAWRGPISGALSFIVVCLDFSWYWAYFFLF